MSWVKHFNITFCYHFGKESHSITRSLSLVRLLLVCSPFVYFCGYFSFDWNLVFRVAKSTNITTSWLHKLSLLSYICRSATGAVARYYKHNKTCQVSKLTLEMLVYFASSRDLVSKSWRWPLAISPKRDLCCFLLFSL